MVVLTYILYKIQFILKKLKTALDLKNGMTILAVIAKQNYVDTMYEL